MKHKTAENKRWVSVRSYLCGDEFNSVLAEEDSASVKSSEATVTQPIHEDLSDKGEAKSEETVENITEKRPNPNTKLLNEEEAAILIQSAYRGLLVSFHQFAYNTSKDIAPSKQSCMKVKGNI